MNLTKAVDRYVKAVSDYFNDNEVSSAVLVLSELLESEEEGLITRNWRSSVEVDKYLHLIKEIREEIENDWERSYNQLKPILDYGGHMEYEEMMLILGLRSDLVSFSRFVASDFLEKYEKKLELIDEDLISVLKLNKNYTRDSRNANRKYTGGLETYLPKHWWWRYDEEN